MRTNEVKSAGRILDLLELLSVVPGPMRLSDIARRMEMPKSSAFALMSTLTGRGYVELDGAFYVIAEHYRNGNWTAGEYGLMRRAAQPLMAALASGTGESCFLAIPANDWHIQYIEKAVSENPLRYDMALPLLRPAHSTSVGLVMLADQPQDLLALYARSGRLEKLTEKTVTDPVRLLADIERVRTDGYATIADSSVMGVSGLAAPIRRASGAVIGALCVIAPTPRFDAARDQITGLVCETARQISAQVPGQAGIGPDGAAPQGHTSWQL